VGSQGNCNSFSPALRFTTLQLMHWEGLSVPCREECT
jgi:hypothetical protein